MNRRTTWVLYLLAGTLLALILFVEQPWREKQARDASRAVLPGFDPAAVTNLDLTPWGERTITARRLARGAAEWRLTQPVPYPANAGPIENLLNALAQLQWQDRLSASELQSRPDASDEYGFNHPQFTLDTQSPDGVRRLAVGATSALGDELFVQVIGSYDIYKVSVQLTNFLPRSQQRWRDMDIVDLKHLDFDALRVLSVGKSFEATRDPVTLLWEMKKPVQARAASPKIDDLLAELDKLNIIAFPTNDNPDNLELLGLQPSVAPQLELTLLRDTNVLFDLQVGSNVQIGSNIVPGVAYARRQDPPGVIVIPTASLMPWQADSTNFLDRHMFSLPVSNIAAIEVTGTDHFAALRQPDGGWSVATERETFPADPLFMDVWLGGFTSLDFGVRKMVVTDLTPYGLDHPQLTYKLDGARTNLLAQIEFGASTNGQAFERRLDESAVNTIDSGDFEHLPRVSWQLRDRQVWKFASGNVVAVTIHHEGGDRKFLRDPMGDWTFAPGSHGPPLINGPYFEEALVQLGQLRAVYWDSVGEDTGDPFGFKAADHRIELQFGQGGAKQILAMEFGGRSPYGHPYAAVVKDGQRLVFEFPADIYENFVVPQLSLPPALRHPN